MSQHSAHLFYSLDSTEFLYQLFKATCIIDIDNKGSCKQAVTGINIDGAHHDTLILGDDGCDIRHNANVVVAYDTQRDGILSTPLATPLRLDDTVSETATQLRSIGTIATMDLYAAGYSDEAEDIVSIYRMTTAGKDIVKVFLALVYDKDIRA